MKTARSITAAMAISIAVAAAGCGVGPGESEDGSAGLRVTTGHGADLLAEATTENPSESETVVRFLDREAEIETSFGGNFVDSINGVEGRVEDGRSLDWYYYVNGVWSPVGAGEATVHADDRIWWDYRDWTSAYRVPAVVGSFPEPFRSGFDGERWPTQLICLDEAATNGVCDAAESALTAAGADLERVDGVRASDPAGSLRVIVGTWTAVRRDKAARTLEGGPGESGVYARPQPCGGTHLFSLDALDVEGNVVAGSSDASWVVTVQDGDDRPTWVVSASSPSGLGDAVAMLDEETLRDKYAVASFDGGEPFALPAAPGTETKGVYCR